jgi:hypothetical protein
LLKQQIRKSLFQHANFYYSMQNGFRNSFHTDAM